MAFAKSAVVTALLASCTSALAFHPLITDDTGTQGAGGNQLEFATTRAKANGAADDSLAVTYARGLSDPLDAFIAMGHSQLSAGPQGMTNSSVGLKWRFYENEASKTSLGIKPLVYLPVSEQKEIDGLGLGRTSPEVTFILTQEMPFGAIHANVMTGRDRNRLSDPASRVRYSLAPAWDITETLQLSFDIGTERTRQTGVTTRENFSEVGLVYTLQEGLALSAGYTHKRDNAETETKEVTVGLTWQFR